MQRRPPCAPNFNTRGLNKSSRLFIETDMEHEYNPRRGDLLIASPFLDDIPFGHSVVLLLDTDSRGGVMGLSLNIPTAVTLGELLPDLGIKQNIEIYSGGPCERDRLFLLHTLGESVEGAMEIMPGLYVGGKIEDVARYLNDGGDASVMRFFLGYSGWYPGQLGNELKEKAWAVSHVKKGEKLFDGQGTEYWRTKIGRLGEDYRPWLILPTVEELN